MLSEDAKAIVASNLVVAQEIRRLVLATSDSAMAPDYAQDSLNIFKKLWAVLEQEGSR